MILVTGGTGLIGSHLLFELTKRGHNVRALKRTTSDIGLTQRLFYAYDKNPEVQLNQIEWINGNIENYDSICNALVGITTVYHCAAMVSFSNKDYSQMLEINVRGTANIVDACIEFGVNSLCHVSSIAALGSSADGLPVNEDAIWGKSKGKSNYAISKFLSEMEVWRGIEQGLNAVIVNPSVIIGPCRWDTGSGQIFGTIAKGFPFYTLGISGYVDVRDVVSAMICATEKKLWGKRFLINGENLSHRTVFNIIAKELGKNPPRIYAKPWMTSIAWRIAWFSSLFTRKTPAINRDTAQSGHSITYYSSNRALEELGIIFHSIADAIKNTVNVGSL